MSEGTSETVKTEKLRGRFSLPYASIGLPLLSVVIAILIGAVIMIIMGYDPINA